jgi:GNAT superfamily N-acetyltransferase
LVRAVDKRIELAKRPDTSSAGKISNAGLAFLVAVTAMFVRRMEERDILDVRELVCRTIDVSYRGAYSAQAIAFFKAYHSADNISKDTERGHALVATAGGRIIGTGTLLDGEIKRVFVDPEMQGQGYGGALMRALIAEAKAEGLGSVSLDASLVSRGMYEHLGFRFVRDGCHDLGDGLTLDYTVMTLDI